MANRVCLLLAALSFATPALAYPQAASAPPSLWLDLRLTDSLSSGARITGMDLRRLPIDDPRQGLALVPGVVLTDGEIGIATSPALSIRGGTPGDAVVYVDGAPVRLQTLGGQGIGLASNAIAAVAVTTGVAPAAIADAGSGVITYTTRSGGDRLAGDVRWDSDEPFGAGSSVGYNRIEGAGAGSFGANLTFAFSATLQGQRSSYRGIGAEAVPIFAPRGIDTAVTLASGAQVVIPGFVQWSGDCDPASNGGVECQGLRRPFDWSTARRVHGKIEYHYGSGSALSFTALGSDLQQRFFPGQLILDPAMYEGERARSVIGIANWRHDAGDFRGAPLAAQVTVSLARESDVGGPLVAASEVNTRDPYLGIAFTNLQFTGLDVFPLPVTDQLVRNVRTNSGLRVPYLNREDLRLAQPHRVNPYGLLSGGWATTGIDGRLSSVSERRLYGRAGVEWSPHAHHGAVGFDAERSTVSLYTSGLLRQAFMDLFLEHPQRIGLYGSDRILLGAQGVLDIGIRYDRYAPGGEFPKVPGRIYSNPNWSPNAATSDTAYASSVARVFQPTRTQTFLSPRLRFTFPVTRAATIRLGYSRAVTAPPWALFFRGANSDLDFTSTGDLFGRDVDFAVTSLIDIGWHLTIRPGLALDVALFQKGLPAYAARIKPFADPLNLGDTINVTVLDVLENASQLGADASVEWRAGDWVGLSATYSLGRAHTEFPGPGVTVESNITKHALAAAAVLQVPDGWRAGSVLGAVGRGVSAVVMLRATSGEPYTRLVNLGNGTIAPGSGLGGAIEPFNASHLPWTKRLDLRLGKSIRAGGRSWEVFADFRNLLNFRNTLALFAETGDVVNDQHRAQLLASEYSNLVGEAASNSALEPDGSTINLSACGSWSDPVNCVALRRVESRFGDGNGLYTLGEQNRALNAYYDAFFGSWRFYGSGRTLRIGAQLEL